MANDTFKSTAIVVCIVIDVSDSGHCIHWYWTKNLTLAEYVVKNCEL